jgi:hypothetical protein
MGYNLPLWFLVTYPRFPQGGDFYRGPFFPAKAADVDRCAEAGWPALDRKVHGWVKHSPFLAACANLLSQKIASSRKCANYRNEAKCVGIQQ